MRVRGEWQDFTKCVLPTLFIPLSYCSKIILKRKPNIKDLWNAPRSCEGESTNIIIRANM